MLTISFPRVSSSSAWCTLSSQSAKWTVIAKRLRWAQPQNTFNIFGNAIICTNPPSFEFPPEAPEQLEPLQYEPAPPMAWFPCVPLLPPEYPPPRPDNHLLLSQTLLLPQGVALHCSHYSYYRLSLPPSPEREIHLSLPVWVLFWDIPDLTNLHPLAHGSYHRQNYTHGVVPQSLAFKHKRSLSPHYCRYH